MVAPVLEELSRELAGRLKVVKVNVDQSPRLSARFDARSIPMLVVIHDGEVRRKLIGAQPKAALRQALGPYL
jgi:thioredoxin 2